MRNYTVLTAAALLILLAAACDSTGIAYGDANSIIAVSSTELWEEIGPEVEVALQPTVRTVRAERKFTVTYQEPMGEYWSDLRRFKQMVLFGTAEDPWMIEAMEHADEEITTPGVHQVEDVWSRGQVVTLVLMPAGGSASDATRHLPTVLEDMERRFRQYVLQRMYVSSGVDSALADTLSLEAGFSLLIPEVYDWELQDSVYIFRNDQPDPSELIRQVAVTWVSPIPQGMQPENILDWRAGIMEAHYSEPQELVLDDSEARPFEYRGNQAYEIQAAWKNPPERGWPAAGPLIVRAVICENQARMYLIDAWLYAPGKEKYEYMIQLQTILDTFRCGAA